jgi:putative oxidoreductase
MMAGLLLLRVIVGLTLAAHGAQKLFGWFGGLGLDRTGQGFAALGFHPGRRHALLAGLAELAGGSLLALGLATPLAATVVVSLMLVAAISVHLRNGFFITENGYEYNLVLAVAALTLAFTGPGPMSIDAALGWSTGGARWGVAALVVGVLGGIVQLAQRHSTGPTVSRETTEESEQGRASVA